MGYTVKEIFYTLQGEGANAGRPAVFCRFTGCNLWTGLEKDRPKAVCQFCDTDFVGTDGTLGNRYETAEKLADTVFSQWPKEQSGGSRPLVVCTGGEPLLQLNSELVMAFIRRGLSVAVETNGTIEPPMGNLWLTVSPKAGAELKIRRGHELKLVFPQPGAAPEQFEHLDFRHFFLQPMDGPDCEKNTELALRYCMEHPRWRLSLQTHKIIGIR